MVYVSSRPGLKIFLKHVSDLFEVVIYTASMKEYADPLLDIIDPHGFITKRFFRQHCTFHNGIYVKDLRKLGRDMKNIFIIDNSPLSY